MGQCLTRRAVEHGRITKLILLDSYRDRTVNGDEFALLLASVDDWIAVDAAADAARALGHAQDRGITDESYRRALTDTYWAAVDDLPPSAA